MLRRVPHILAIAFIGVTLQRVAAFAGDGMLAWFFSIGLAAGVFVSAYYTSFTQTQRIAFVCLLFFVAVDGVMNMAETAIWSMEQGRWSRQLEITGSYTVPLWRVTDTIYGLFPTFAVALLGWLGHRAEKIPQRRRRNNNMTDFVEEMKSGILQWLFGHLDDGPTVQEIQLPPREPDRQLARPRRATGDLPASVPASPSSTASVRDQVFAYMDDLPPRMRDEVSTREIARAIGCAPSTASVHLRAYREQAA